MKPKRFPRRRAQRRAEAELRQQAYERIGTEEKLARPDLGEKERVKLHKRLG